MILLTNRLMSILFVFFSILILSTIYLSNYFHPRMGAVSGVSINSDNNSLRFLHYDLNTGAVVQEDADPFRYTDDMRSSECLTQLDEGESIYYIKRVSFTGQEFELVHQQGEQKSVLASYDGLSIAGTCWLNENNHLNFVHNDEDTQSSILYTINLETGERTTLIAVPDFRTGFVQLSPDKNYLILSDYEDPGFDPTPTSSYQHLFIQVASGSVTDMGQLAFTSWSPDNSNLIIGNKDEDVAGIQLSRYDIENHRAELLDITVAEPNTPFTYSDSLRWSPDSQHLALVNFQHELLIVNPAGESTFITEDIKPLSWSPDGRYLLANGFDSDLAFAAYLIDSQEGSIQAMRPENGFQESRMNLRWSSNSRYIALFQSLDTREPVISITVFNAEAEIVRGELNLSVPDNLQLQPFNMNWKTV